MNIDHRSMRVVCYGDSNTWGWVPGKAGSERFQPDERWTGVMQGRLGEKYEVLEAGFGGRTTVHDDPRPEMSLRNGLETLPMTLESFSPVDAVILMLGTTDCKEMMGLTAEQITHGMELLISTVRKFKLINGKAVAEIIVAAPLIPNESVGLGAILFKGGTAKGVSLRSLYAQLARRMGCRFIDVNDFATADKEEGVHMGAESHERLGQAMADFVLGIGS